MSDPNLMRDGVTETSMTEHDDLLDCPFCGDEAGMYSSSMRDDEQPDIMKHMVSCEGCEAHSSTFDGYAFMAADAWNTRMPSFREEEEETNE